MLTGSLFHRVVAAFPKHLLQYVRPRVCGKVSRECTFSERRSNRSSAWMQAKYDQVCSGTNSTALKHDSLLKQMTQVSSVCDSQKEIPVLWGVLLGNTVYECI